MALIEILKPEKAQALTPWLLSATAGLIGSSSTDQRI